MVQNQKREQNQSYHPAGIFDINSLDRYQVQYKLMKQEEVRVDQQFQVLLSEYFIVEPELHCNKQKRICRMCVNPACQEHSLICQDPECQNCGEEKHLHCQKLQLTSITTLLSQRNHQLKDFMLDICKIEDRFIEQIHKSRQILIKQYYLGDLQENYLKIVEEIYRNKNTKYLTGKQAKEFYQRLTISNGKSSQKAALLLQNYQLSINNFFYETLKLKNQLYEAFFQVEQLPVPQKFTVESQILKKHLLIDLSPSKVPEQLVVKHSKPLVDEFIQGSNSFLMKALNNPKRLELLYRASENAFSAAAFHQKCDNVPDTLTIVRTEFGKTIAGFTKYTWNAIADGWVHDSGRHAFLLSLDLKQKMVPTSDEYLIRCNSSIGPRFGSDLCIADQCHNNTDSYCYFPSHYNCERANKYANNQNSYRAFSGAKIGHSFRVVEYEVFRVVY